MKKDIIEKLENIVMKRFKNIKEIKTYLKEEFKDYKIDINYASMIGVDTYIDYDIVGLLESSMENIFCYFDIYYAKTRNKEMYITEVGYEFE